MVFATWERGAENSTGRVEVSAVAGPQVSEHFFGVAFYVATDVVGLGHDPFRVDQVGDPAREGGQRVWRLTSHLEGLRDFAIGIGQDRELEAHQLSPTLVVLRRVV